MWAIILRTILYQVFRTRKYNVREHQYVVLHVTSLHGNNIECGAKEGNILVSTGFIFRILNKFDDQRSTEKIFTRTNPVVAFLSCSYRGFDCRKKWTKVLTKYGLCQQLHPNALFEEKVSSNLILAITVGKPLWN